jgi:hypothetical protein
MGRSYCLITKGEHLRTPFLAELSRRTGVGENQVAYYQPNVLYLPYGAVSVIQSLFCRQKYFRSYAVVIKKAFVECMESPSSTAPCLSSKEMAFSTAIAAVLEKELHVWMACGQATRSKMMARRKVFERTIELRRMRLKEESHLALSFVEDCDRAIGELRFVLEQQREG